MARYNTLDNQAPVQQELKASDPKVGRSAFDYSHVHCGTALVGALTPVLCMEVVPNEDIDINLNALVQIRNPLTRPLLNGMRVYFHGYCNYLVDLWEGAKNFLDAGRSGTISLPRPNLIYSYKGINNDTNAAVPLGLLSYLGLPPQVVIKKAHSSSGEINIPPLYWFASYYYREDSEFVPLSGAPDFFPADVCMAYQRNWRDFYSNKNLLQNNKYWFPDNEDNFILSYECVNAVAVNHGNEMLSNDIDPTHVGSNISGISPGSYPSPSFTPESNNPATYGDGLSELWRSPNLSGLKFRQFKGDRFTTGSPFPELLRGDIPVLTTHASETGWISGTFGTIAGPGETPGVPATRVSWVQRQGSSTPETEFLSTPSGPSAQRVYPWFEVSSTNITLNDIRALETFTVFKERMARTNGDYNNMIEAQFGYNPHHHVREATYIGGFYMDFHMSTVVQQSASTSEDALGTKAGDANANGSGRIGHIHTRDYGWIQVYMSIVPDVFYTQGLQRQFSRKVQTDMYFPLFNNLAPQAILNKELYVSGTPSMDNDVFAYEDRYAEFKHCNNRVTGLMALPHEVAEYDASRIMARRFTNIPALNNQFVTLVPENVDMSVFTVTDEPPFDFQIGFNIRRVSPMPYVSIPGSMSSNLHA